jgi:hypothetical protein
VEDEFGLKCPAWGFLQFAGGAVPIGPVIAFARALSQHKLLPTKGGHSLHRQGPLAALLTLRPRMARTG